MKQQIKQLEKISYNLERVFDEAKQIRAQQKLEETIASWTKECKQCGSEFYPTRINQVRCRGCQQ